MRIAGVVLVIVTACTPVPTGPFTRARADAEPIGENCPLGGVAIRTGIAADGEHTITDEEVTATTYLCKPAAPLACPAGTSFHGSVTIPLAANQTEALRGVTCIDGDLLVLDMDEPDGNGLGDLATVTGNVAFAGNPYLMTIDGFPHLREVGATFLLQGNDGLGDLHGLSSLASVGSLAIIANDQLPDLAGLEISKLSNGVIVAQNPQLSSLFGLDTLTTTGDVTITGNAELSTLAALDHLQFVGSLTISSDPALTSFEPRALATIGGDLAIADNSALVSVTLPTATIGGRASFDGNIQLAQIDARSLATAAGFHAGDDPHLATLSAPSLGSIGELELSNVPALAAVDLRSLAAVAKLSLDHAGLASLFTLQSLDTLSIRSCPNLHDLRGLDAITTLSSFEVTHSGVGSFTGLDALTSVTGDFTFKSNTLKGAPVKAFAARLKVDGTISID